VSVKLPFRNRAEAGRLLGEMLAADAAAAPDSLALGLVRGGAVIAQQLAAAARLSWDILIVRKIGAPYQPEYAVGAYAEPGATLFNPEALHSLHLDKQWQEQAAARAAQQCTALQQELRGGQGAPDLRGRHVVLTDDGIATGFSMFAAIEAAHQAGAAQITVAVPVLAPAAKADLMKMDLSLVYLACPAQFHAVGQFYVDFGPVTSAEVRALLDQRT